jgi:hypothetical protein
VPIEGQLVQKHHKTTYFMRISKKKLVTAAAIGLSLASLSCFALNPPYLLTVNDANPANVIVTATGVNSLANTTGQTANNGVNLLGFFGQDEVNMSTGQFPSGTLTGGSLTTTYDSVSSDNQSTSGGAFLDLSLSLDIASPQSGQAENFSTASPAFTGTWSFDLVDLGTSPSALPAPGQEGNILAGDSTNPGQIIGEWEIVPAPEPGVVSLLAVGTLISIFFGNRRHSANNQR